jgi:NAD(P)-dependent dehydrogenase (short-subunit alcohol dehydrogenase family)
VEDASAEDWDAIIGTNVKGYAFAIKHAIRVMKQRPGSEKRPCE